MHAGSALEYGEVNGDLDEVQTKCEPQTTYGQTKLRGTLNLARHCSRSTFRGVTARLFTVYGPGEPEGRLLPSLMQFAKSGIPLDLTAGQQCRDFTYVDEVAEGLLRLGAGECAARRGRQSGQWQIRSVRSFVETAARILSIPNDRLRFGQLATRPEEMQHGEVAVVRLQSLRWLPSLTIEGGIGRTVEFLEAPVHDWSAQPVEP